MSTSTETICINCTADLPLDAPMSEEYIPCPFCGSRNKNPNFAPHQKETNLNKKTARIVAHKDEALPYNIAQSTLASLYTGTTSLLSIFTFIYALFYPKLPEFYLLCGVITLLPFITIHFVEARWKQVVINHIKKTGKRHYINYHFEGYLNYILSLLWIVLFSYQIIFGFVGNPNPTEDTKALYAFLAILTTLSIIWFLNKILKITGEFLGNIFSLKQ